MSEKRKPRIVIFDTDDDFGYWTEDVVGKHMAMFNQQERIEHLLWLCLRFLFFLACRPGRIR